MVFYAGHDDTTYSLHTILGQPIPDQWLYFLGHFEFELWETKTGKMMVRRWAEVRPYHGVQQVVASATISHNV